MSGASANVCTPGDGCDNGFVISYRNLGLDFIPESGAGEAFVDVRLSDADLALCIKCGQFGTGACAARRTVDHPFF